MSLVTTPTVNSPDSVRHRAATRAVLPLPTGPPTPMRVTRPWGSASPSDAEWSLWAGGRSAALSSGRKESYLRDGVDVGEQVERRCAVGGKFRSAGNRSGARVDERGEPGEHALAGKGVEAEQPHRRRRGCGDRAECRGPGGEFGRAAGLGDRGPEHQRVVRGRQVAAEHAA